uniref:Armadillo repeat-containing domain-containing protein n=1 Tax=Trichuris muris TaxID=70415 RepID=A0A5S6QX80_TRIMR
MLKSTEARLNETNAYRAQRRADSLLERRGIEPPSSQELSALVGSLRSSNKDEAYNALCQLCTQLSESPDIVSSRFVTISNSVYTVVGLLTKSNEDGRVWIKALDLLVLLSLGTSYVCRTVARLAGAYALHWTFCELLHIVWRAVVLVGNLAGDADARVAKLLVKQGVVSQVALLLHHDDDQMVEASLRAILIFLNSGTVDVNCFAQEGRTVRAVRLVMLRSTSKSQRCIAAFIYFHLMCFESWFSPCGTSNFWNFFLFSISWPNHSFASLKKETLWVLCNFTAAATDYSVALLTFEDGSFLVDTLSNVANRPLDAVYVENGALQMRDDLRWTAADIPVFASGWLITKSSLVPTH